MLPGFGRSVRSAALGLAPGSKIGLGLLFGSRIEAEDRTAFHHLLSDEILKNRHFGALVSQFIGKMPRHYDHTIMITYDNVAWPHGCITASDWNIDIQGLVKC